MTHDPMCPRSDSRNGQHCEDCGPWCQCHLIAKVRADTLDKALDAVEDAWDQGYNYAPSRVQAMRAIVAQREKS